MRPLSTLSLQPVSQSDTEHPGTMGGGEGRKTLISSAKNHSRPLNQAEMGPASPETTMTEEAEYFSQ
jgi:hypothetical protein